MLGYVMHVIANSFTLDARSLFLAAKFIRYEEPTLLWSDVTIRRKAAASGGSFTFSTQFGRTTLQ